MVTFNRQLRPKICGKRLIRSFVVYLLACSIVMSTGCNTDKTKRYTTHLIGYFDTVITIIGYCDQQKTFDRYVEMAEEEFSQLHQLCDRYHAYPDIANVRTINLNAGKQPVQVPEVLVELIQTALIWQEETEEGVNIALGSVLDIWHNYRTMGIADPGQAQLPALEDLTEADRHTDSQQIEINPAEKTVFLRETGMSLDLGALAKGYATERVAQKLIEAGWTSFAISSGGNVRTVGAPIGGDRNQWSIGIEDPNKDQNSDENALIDTVYLTDGSVVTSGDYQRYYTVNGKRYHHIIDPETLMPADHFSSVTIVTEDSGWADYLSTLLFVLPYDEGVIFAEKNPDVDVLWVFSDGQTQMTDGMASRLKSMGAVPD